MFADLAITARTTLLFQCFDPTFESGAQRAGIFNEIIELGSIALGSGVISVVEGARVEVADACNVVVESPEAVLEGRDLRSWLAEDMV